MTVSTTMDAPAKPFVEALSGTFGATVKRAVQDFKGDEGDVRVLDPEHAVVPRAAFVGLGPASDLDAKALRSAAVAAADVALRHEAETVVCLMPAEEASGDARTAQGLVEGGVLGTDRFLRYKTADGFEGPSAFLVHVGDDRDQDSMDEGIGRGRHLAAGAGTDRALVNQSPDEKTACQFADTIVASGDEHGGQVVETWDEDRIYEEVMGEPPALRRGGFDPPASSGSAWASATPSTRIQSSWLHLDLAGPALRKTVQTRQPAGGTGFGVHLLCGVPARFRGGP